MDLGSAGGAAHAKISAAKALDEHHTHICISVLCQRGQSDGRKDTLYLSTVAMIHSYQDWKDNSRDRRRG